MPTNYAGNPANNPTSIQIPSDGDGPVQAADVNVALEGLMDRTAYIEALTQPVTNYDRVQVATCVESYQACFRMEVNGQFTQIADSNVNNGILLALLDLPEGCSLSGVTVYFDPINGHPAFPGGAPTVPPQLSLNYVTVATGAITNLGAVNDPEAVLATYESLHPLSVSCTHTVVRSTRRYYATFRGEGGTNYLSGLVVWGFRASYSIAKLDTGAA